MNLPPQDITIEILKWLPFRSVIRCKLVSKKWKNLINDPEFHTAFSNNNSTSLFFSKNNLYCLDDNRRDPPLEVHWIPRNSRWNPPFAVHRIPMELNINYYEELFLGWSNGVACVKADHNHFLVYNLFTGASYSLAHPSERQYYVQGICFGFGYDRYADDHNIFLVYKNTPGDFFIYSLKNKGWKSFKGFPYDAYDWTKNAKEMMSHQRGGPCSYSGTLHWLVFTKNTKEVIFTYDLHTRRFGEMLTPSASWPYEEGHNTCISEINGHLCYSYQKGYLEWQILKLDLWAMKEYGNVDSWEKFVSIDFSLEIIGTFADSMSPTLLYEREDDRKLVMLVYHYIDALFWYDIDKDLEGFLVL